METVSFKKSCLNQVKLTRSLGWDDLRETISMAEIYLEMEVRKTKIQLKLL